MDTIPLFAGNFQAGPQGLKGDDGENALYNPPQSGGVPFYAGVFLGVDPDSSLPGTNIRHRLHFPEFTKAATRGIIFDINSFSPNGDLQVRKLTVGVYTHIDGFDNSESSALTDGISNIQVSYDANDELVIEYDTSIGNFFSTFVSGFRVFEAIVTTANYTISRV